MKPIISKITDKWIQENRPCEQALKWWDKKEREPIKILKLLIKSGQYSWANWFIVIVMTYHDYVSYAVFAAEQVIGIYEKEYPNDDRPRKTIEAAEECIKDPTEKNKAAADAAADAAYAAAYAAAGAADVAADAADVAADVAARAAANAAAGAAYAAADAAYAAAESAYAAAGAARAVAGAADAAMQLKILRYGMELLGGVR